MKGISHKQAVRLIHLRLDGLLKESQSLSLNAHLDSCDSCRAYAAEMDALPVRLQNEFHVRWDQNIGPSQRVFEQVNTRAKRIPITNRITSSLRLTASAFLVAFLILGINFMILQMKSTPIDTIGTQSVSGSELINNRLIAFTSEKDGNFDIYTMRGDGSNLTNLTNNPAQDVNPVWSPDGKHIVFESDRAGSKQIYLMNSDGSNIVQLTNDEVDHQLPVTDDSRHNIWSSDGNKILFLQNDQDGKTWTLSSIHINGENKTTLISDTRQFATASWSPNGDYIGLVLFDKLEPDRLLPNLYVIDADGNNLREIKKFLPQEEHIFFPYIWSSDGQSVIFPAHRLNPSSQTVYELRLRDNALNTVATITPLLFDWYDGIALITDFNIESQPLVWLRPDGSTTELDYLKGENPADCYLDKARSLRGNLAIGSYCKQDDKVLLYWTNTDGSTIQQLPDLEVPVVNGGHIGGLTLSPDEKFVTFNFESDDETNLYIWNIEDALNDSSVQPIRIVIGKGELHYFPSWQPVVNNDILEEEQTQTDKRLVAFTSDQGGNAEIYTMYADGSNLTNITNSSAHDVNPVWSPDGKLIAFESDRTGFIQIYTMNADGSNLTQITNEAAEYAIGTNYGNTPEPWSPDGKKIIFSQTVRGDANNMLYVMDADGRNKIALTGEPGLYTFLGWSPDGQKIVYQTPNPDHNPETRIMIANVDGTSTMDGIVGKDFGISSQIQWETPDQLVLLGYNSNIEPPVWQLSRMFITTDTSVYNGFGPTIVASNVPIVALFENTYVAEDQDALRWFAFNGSPVPMSPWNFPAVCEKPVSDQTSPDTYHTVSPDQKYAFVVILCGEGAHFYLENADGTQINQLGTSIAGQAEVNALTWSPDGKHVIVTTSTDSSTNSTNLFRFDVQEMLNDPFVKPIKLTTDDAWKYGVAWQPILSHEVFEEKPTQTPSDNRLLAFTSAKDGNFDIYTMHANGSGLTNITNNPAVDANPFWSPDGKRIAFESDRAGFRQIYLMNDDGSSVIQLTDDEAESELGMKYYSNSASFPWSPEGNKIIFSQRVSGDEESTPYVMDIDGNNKMPLVSEPGIYSSPSWSPDGKHIAFISIDPQDPNLQRLYVVDADGKNLRDVTRKLPSDEALGGYNEPGFYWSRDGKSIFFIASNVGYVARNGSGGDNNNIYKWKVYETSPNGNVLISKASTHSPIGGWWQGTYFITSFVGHSAWTWVRPDSIFTVNPLENCQERSGGGTSYKRSSNGNVVVGAHCSNGDSWFYWANSNGTVFSPLVNSPINAPESFSEFAWSSDDKYIAFNIISSDKTNMYILNVEEALQKPSNLPVQIIVGGGDLYYIPSWQPIINNDIVEEKPTPEPTRTSSSDGLIAFTADNNNATNPNMDIYTIRLDGSNLTNLTHDPAKDFNADDYNPAWSPDRKKLAFMSERGGNMTGNANIFVMNRDGNELTQLTYHPGNDAFLSWSPNGERIVYYSSPNGETNAKGQLIIMDADGSDKTVLTTLGYYYFLSWSPDNQKIVYVKPGFDGASYKDAGIYVVGIDGKNQHEWFIDNIHQIHWEDSEHFLGVVQTDEDTQAVWTLYQFNTDGSQIELASHNAPIVAIFERTYVVEGQDGLTWFALEGAPISLSPWNVAEKCETTGDSYVSTSLSIAPDQKRALVIIYCKDATWHYFVNEDGSEINQLGAPIDSSVGILPYWSLDGQYISLFVINYGDDLYLIDIQKMLNDPSATPILLATNVLAGVLYAEPLIASNDDEEKQTPESPTFSLSVYEAEKVAFFDVLEPSYLPVGYALEGVAYNPWTQQVAMKYISQQGNASMLIYQQHGDLLHDPAVSGYVTPVPVGGREGEYIQGAWIYESPDTTTPTWDLRADSYSLTWQNGEFVFSINFIGGETITHLSFNELVAIAESLK